jgi:hypothetical protein
MVAKIHTDAHVREGNAPWFSERNPQLIFIKVAAHSGRQK